MNPINILLADNQYLTRTGLKQLISTYPNIKVIAEAENSKLLLKAITDHNPQVLIFDYNDEDSFNKEDIKKSKQISPALKILVISGDKKKEAINDILAFGATGFLTKNCSKEEIKDAIYAIARGSKFFCDKILDIILNKHLKPEGESCTPTELTNREIEIVQLVTAGLTAKEIAYHLNLSLHTIYTHRKNVMKKLNIKTESELVFYAIKTGIMKENIEKEF